MHDVTQRGAPERVEYIERYTPGVRTSHWLTALCFVLAALSGLALFHPALSWLFGLFGGGPWTRILHPFFGLAMVLAFLALAARVASQNGIEARDCQWLRQWRDVVSNREDRLPEVGKYNGGQKVLFWLMVILLLTLFATGFLFWRPWFAPYVPVTGLRLASLVHSAAAALLVVLIIIHVYAAIWVKGSVRAMMQGYVSARWARRHHSLWYRDATKERP
jgi:formate dehydrogenase subunit gamma